MNIERHYFNALTRPQTLEAYKNWDDLFDIEKLILDTEIHDTDNVIEFGCGGGRIAKYIANKCHNYVGLDISPEMIEISRNKLPNLRFYISDVTIEPKFNKKTFNCVLFMHNGIDSIYPSERREKVFIQANNLLCENGILIYSTHLEINNNNDFVVDKAHRYYVESYYGAEIWLHRATFEDAIKEVTKFGFIILDTHIINKDNADSWIYIVAKKV